MLLVVRTILWSNTPTGPRDHGCTGPREYVTTGAPAHMTTGALAHVFTGAPAHVITGAGGMPIPVHMWQYRYYKGKKVQKKLTLKSPQP